MPVRLATVTLLSLALISAPADALNVKKRNESWGKPGVTFSQYRADALECANVTYGAPIVLHQLPPRPTGFLGISVQDGEMLDLRPGHVKLYTTTLIEGVKHATWMDVSEQLQRVLDQCLIEKGYSRFRLTSDQMERLKQFRKMSPERQQYLYQLGSDATVVVPQKL